MFQIRTFSIIAGTSDADFLVSFAKYIQGVIQTSSPLEQKAILQEDIERIKKLAEDDLNDLGIDPTAVEQGDQWLYDKKDNLVKGKSMFISDVKERDLFLNLCKRIFKRKFPQKGN